MTMAVPQVFGILLTNIVVAIIILLIGFVVGKILGALLHKLFSTLFAGKKIKGKKNSSFALGLSSLVSTLIYIAAVILALDRLGITRLVINILLVAISIILLGYALFVIIEFASNFYFGINIIISKKFEIGDRIKIRKIEGTIKKITLVNTYVITNSGDLFVFSNKLLTKGKYSIEKNSNSTA